MVAYAFHFHLYNFDVWKVSLNLKCLWELCLVTGTAEFQAYTWRKLGFGHVDFINSPVWLQARRQTGRSSDGCTPATSLERSRHLFPVLNPLQHSALLTMLFCCPTDGWWQHSRKIFCNDWCFSLRIAYRAPQSSLDFHGAVDSPSPCITQPGCPMGRLPQSSGSPLISLCPFSLGASWTQVPAW